MRTRQADCSGPLVFTGWGGEQGHLGGRVGAGEGSERKQMDSPTGTGSTELARRAVAICPAVSVPCFHNYPTSPPRLTRGCRGHRPANLESGARATLFQLPGFTSSQRQLGGEGDIEPQGD